MGLDPVTMFAVSAVMQLGQGAMGYLEQKSADKKAKRMADAEAAIMEQDAAKAAALEKKEAKSAAARQRMLYLASGVDLSGSPLLEVQRTVRQGQQNADTVMGNAKSRADLIRAQGGMSRASLVGSAMQTGQGLLGNYMNYQVLKQQLQPARASEKITWNDGTTSWT